MHTLYDSDSYSVVHIFAHEADAEPADARPRLPRHGFEIVDKRAGKGIYLDGCWADLFERQINAWQQNRPTQDEVEDTLEGYATLAQTPLAVH